MKKLIALMLIFLALGVVNAAAAPSWSNQGQSSSIGWINGVIGLHVKAIPGPGHWALSKASYTGTNISTQDGSSQGLFWKDDGSKLYEIGKTGDLFYSYDCSTGWDLSSCTYNNVNLSTQDPYSRGMFWNSDGSKLYEIGSGGGLFYSYDCSTGWDLSSCTYNNVNLSTQDGSPQGLFWKDDGSKLYEIGSGGDLFYSYDCSTGWDLSSCSYNNVNLSTQDGSPQGLFWKDDGSKLYDIGSGGSLFYSYNCSTPWDLSSCSYTGINLSTQSDNPTSLFWKSDGGKLYEIDYGTDIIYSYDLKTSLDTATLATNASGSYSNVSTKDLGGALTETWSNFTYSLPSDCDKTIGWKQYIKGSSGGVNTTDVMGFDLYPHFSSTTDASVLNSIKSCTSAQNITLEAQADGGATATVLMKKFSRLGFEECNYGVEGADKITTNNLTDYCEATLTISGASSGDEFTVEEEPATSGEQPSNLPAAVAGGIVGALSLIYVVKRWKS